MKFLSISLALITLARSELASHPHCGDAIFEPDFGEMCDNGDEEGCTNWEVDEGYRCFSVSGYPSLCYIPYNLRKKQGKTCGNGQLEEEERCDDGNKKN